MKKPLYDQALEAIRSGDLRFFESAPLGELLLAMDQEIKKIKAKQKEILKLTLSKEP